MNKIKWIIIGVLLALVTLVLFDRFDRTTSSDVGREIEDVGEELGDFLDDTGDELEDSLN